MEKLLPQSIEAECGVLGSIIIDPEAITKIDGQLSADDFYRDAHRTIYEAMYHLYQHREPPDFITICDALERRNQLEDVGGASYITSLIHQVPTSGNVEYYACIVAQKATFRRLIHAAGQIAALAYAEHEDAQERAEALLFQIGHTTKPSDFEPMESITMALLTDLERIAGKHGETIGVPTGFHTLDFITGGLQRSDLVILAARPGIGKSSLALSLAYNAAQRGSHVAYASLEMSKKQLDQRLLCFATGANTTALRQGLVDSWDEVVIAGDRIAALPLWIDDTAALSTSELRSKVRRLQAERGVDLVIVDYLQLMHAEVAGGRRYDVREREISEISEALKSLAKELDIPVLALAQLNRAVEGRGSKVPQLSDLRESGAIEQNADAVLFIYRDDYYAMFEGRESKSPNMADILIAKHRNGEVGSCQLYFAAGQTRFFNSEEEKVLAYAR